MESTSGPKTAPPALTEREPLPTALERCQALEQSLADCAERCRTAGDELVWRGLNRLRHQASAHRSVAAVAAELGGSRSEFYRRFQRATGMTPHDYRLAVRIQLTIELMRSTAWTQEAIARAVGWNSTRSLRRTTQRWLGTTPRQLLGALRSGP